MKKAERLFQLVNLIKQHQPISAAKLADLLQISVRSVYRYIDDLNLSNVPIYGEPGVGYRLQEGFELPPLTLTHDEMDALLLAIEMLGSSNSSTLPNAAQSLLQKIKTSLPLTYHQLRQNGIHAIALSEAISQSAIWQQLLHAIQLQVIIKIHDDDKQQRELAGNVLPLGLFYWNGKWTLAGWCQLRNNYRSFRIDHISDITITNQHFMFNHTINLDAFMSYQNRQANLQYE